MPRTTTPLNATQIEKAKPKVKEFNLSDGQGLMLRVKPTGSKAWYFNYYHPHSKRRKAISLGSYPAVSLAHARQERQKCLELLARDIDPQNHREQERLNKASEAMCTFENVARDWMRIYASKVNLKTMGKIERFFEKDVFPVLGRIPISSIDAPTAINVLSTIINRGSHEIARKVARRLNNVMTHAVNTGLVHSNPLAGIKDVIPSTPVRHQATVSPEELPELIKAIRFSSAKVVTRCLIEWQLHTMVRPGEAAECRWSELDIQEATWHIPAERMKSGRPHTVPLSKQALSLLEIIKPISGNRAHVFPSHSDPNKPANRQSANKALRDMGFTGRQTAHGLRALASTVLNESGFDTDVIESALAHKDENTVRAAYNRANYLNKRAEMMQWWSSYIDEAFSR